MNSVFSALTPGARRDQRLAYRDFLAARDGSVDIERRTLSRREESMGHFLAPAPCTRDIDRSLFDAQYACYDPRRETPPEVLLLLALVKINAAEAYGVERMMDPLKARLRADPDDAGALDLVVTIEEDYHTKILLSASVLYGMTITAPYRPRASLRALMGAIASVSHTLSRPIILVAELLGTIYFLDLLRVAREVLRDLPIVRDAIEQRIIDVIIDEVGHVSYNRLCLGPLGLAQARMLCPIVAAGLGDVVPEFRTLGLTLGTSVDRPLHTRSDLPDEVRRRAFFA